MMLADIYHHVLERSVSPEAAKIAISDAHLDGRLRLYCAERRERKTLPEPKKGPVFLEPGEKPQILEAREEPAEGFGHPLPTPEIVPNCLIAWGAFDNWDWERSRATRHDLQTGSHFEYVDIYGDHDEVFRLWPLPDLLRRVIEALGTLEQEHGTLDGLRRHALLRAVENRLGQAVSMRTLDTARARRRQR
jgi:hypothetical protein